MDVRTVNYHLKQIFESGELSEGATIRKIGIVQPEGDRSVERAPLFYNLDAIIAVGYRVNSYQATQFRIWATSVLKEFLVKGYVLDDERLKQGRHFGKDYFDDLLSRITRPLKSYISGLMLRDQTWDLPHGRMHRAAVFNGRTPLWRRTICLRKKSPSSIR